MKIETYDVLWQNCIKPAAEEILSLYDRDCRARYNWHLDETDDTRAAVYKKYQDYRDIIHKSYFGGKSMMCIK
ncbi:MAG: hypothetical protein IJ661_07500 [Lachnospiraceae bacterium]|nr:hypothetical protein [Lachnospiraceae bacterium]